MTYYLSRIKPFLFAFLAIQTLMRLLFMVREIDNLPLVMPTLAKGLAIGVLFDLSVFGYCAAIVGLFLLVLPQARHGSKTDAIVSGILTAVFTFTILFTGVSEWFFWEEFAARFNFIAVDYLVYTHEVVGNIRESYPVVPIISAIALCAVAAGYYYARTLMCVRHKAPAARVRWSALVVGLAWVAAGYWTIPATLSQASDNRYLNEISKNGYYELFSAFWHNELHYGAFYATADDSVLEPILAKKLGGAPSQPRTVAPQESEQHYNLVLITVESLSADFMGTFGNTDGLTPNLDRLAQSSLLFTNLFATGTRTVYGLSALSLAIPPLPGNAIVRRPNNEGLFTIGSVLSEKGYDSTFFYGGYGYFDNMNYFFEHNGYRVVDRNSLAADESEFGNVWGVADEYLYKRVLRDNDRSYAERKPFFNMIMTTSNHRPFTYPDGRIDIPSHSGRKGAVKYTDYAIGAFIEEARKHPWFDRTLFVVVADHTAGSAGKADLNPNGYHIPMLVYAPGLVTPRRYDNMTSQIDIPPTLLGLMNLHYNSRFWGQDVLRAPSNRAFISNYQQLGYLTPERLAVLKPRKEIDIYRKIGQDFVKEHADPQDAFILEALSYYQNAEHWQEWNRQ